MDSRQMTHIPKGIQILIRTLVGILIILLGLTGDGLPPAGLIGIVAILLPALVLVETYAYPSSFHSFLRCHFPLTTTRSYGSQKRKKVLGITAMTMKTMMAPMLPVQAKMADEEEEKEKEKEEQERERREKEKEEREGDQKKKKKKKHAFFSDAIS